MIPGLLSLATSRAGILLAAAVVVAGLSLTIYIQGLRLDAKDGEITSLRGEISSRDAQLNAAEATNKRQADKIREITERADAAKVRADIAARDLAAALARTDEKTRTIIREIPRAANDNDPITAGERDLLIRLREAYPATANGNGSAPRR